MGVILLAFGVMFAALSWLLWRFSLPVEIPLPIWGQKPIRYVVAILAFPIALLVVAQWEIVPAYLIGFLIAWILRRPVKGLRGHLWGFAAVVAIPGIISLGAIVWNWSFEISAIYKALALFDLAGFILLADFWSEYRIKHGLGKR